MRENNTKPDNLTNAPNEPAVPWWQRLLVQLMVLFTYLWFVTALLAGAGFVVIWLGVRRQDWHLVSIGLYLWVPLGLLVLWMVCMTLLADFTALFAGKAHLAEKPPDLMLENALMELRSRTPEQIVETRARILAASRPTASLPPDKTLDAVLFGKWPGNESDEEINAALEEFA